MLDKTYFDKIGVSIIHHWINLGVIDQSTRKADNAPTPYFYATRGFMIHFILVLEFIV